MAADNNSVKGQSSPVMAAAPPAAPSPKAAPDTPPKAGSKDTRSNSSPRGSKSDKQLARAVAEHNQQSVEGDKTFERTKAAENPYATQFSFSKKFGIFKQWAMQSMGKAEASPDPPELLALFKQFQLTQEEMHDVFIACQQYSAALKSIEQAEVKLGQAGS